MPRPLGRAGRTRRIHSNARRAESIQQRIRVLRGPFSHPIQPLQATDTDTGAGADTDIRQYRIPARVENHPL